MKEKKSIKLNDVYEGDKVIIRNIDNIALKSFLAQIGVFENTEVRISKIAPSGSPIALQTNDSEIAIRKEVAAHIEVQRV